MQGWLLSLYPKVWLDQYGDEYAALLEDTGLSFAVVFDILKAVFLLRLRLHIKGLYIASGAVFAVASSVACLKLGLTANVLFWAPTNFYRAVGLAITLAPVL